MAAADAKIAASAKTTTITTISEPHRRSLDVETQPDGEPSDSNS